MKRTKAEIRWDGNGELDEIVGEGVFHLEQMDTGHWWIMFGTHNGVHVNLNSSRKITATVLDERDP